jgi:DNA-binding HxlR family transcriptional regulator
LPLAETVVNGRDGKVRTGAEVLSLLAGPLNFLLLRSLCEGPKSQTALRRETGAPAQSTLRSHLRSLEGLGAIVKHRANAFPGSIEYRLTKAGEELQVVVLALEHWLRAAPDEPLALGGAPARGAIRAIVEAWSSTMLRGLAVRPLSLTELDSIIRNLNYPSIERRLSAMRHTGMVSAVASNGKGTPYAVTDWLRLGIGPIAAASRWERLHIPDRSVPIARLDAETALLLAMPLLRLPVDLSGACRLVVELPSGNGAKLATVTATVDKGRVVSSVAKSKPAEAWASGSPSAWFSAAVDSDPAHLEAGGDSRLVRFLAMGLFEALYGRTGKLEMGQL